MTALDSYSIPEETQKLFLDGIILNVNQGGLPKDILSHAKAVKFEGSRLPCIPINWRFAESIAALKAFEAAMLSALVTVKCGLSDPIPAVMNTDHCQLLFMSSTLIAVDPPEHFEIRPTPIRELSEKYAHLFPLQDPHNFASTFHRRAASNIYKTADGKWIHLHGSLNPEPTIRALGLPVERPDITTHQTSYKAYIDTVAKHDAAELELLLNEEYRQACTIVNTVEEHVNSEQGRANADINLYRVTHRPLQTQLPCWWPYGDRLPASSSKRPLAGLKVVDLTRVIAGPSTTRGLAELGVSVMRVTAKHLPDFTGLHPDLNWGKWNCSLDLRKDEDREKLKALIIDADVVVDGYRPGTFEKYGFGVDGVFKLCQDRKRGIIYARENAYGWEGPLKGRSGWQPISDANTGISYGFGRAMGLDEPCTPVFPNSDYCTGVVGCIGILEALIKRGQSGGSCLVDFALNYYNRWLATTCGQYPQDVWQDVWTRNGRPVFRHYESMNVTVPAYIEMLQKNGSQILRPEFFERRTSGFLGLDFQVVRPAIRFATEVIKLGYNVGTRGNGTDQARWPTDLGVETVV